MSSTVDLFAPYDYLAARPGKDVRRRLMMALDHWIGLRDCSPVAFDGICNVIARLHNASLMLDDIEDNSELRRGAPAAHMQFGTPRTINTANHVMLLALTEILQLPAKCATESNLGQLDSLQGRLASVYAEELDNLHRGQGLDIAWRETSVCPTLAEYEMMVIGKTGGLFRLTVRLMMEMKRFFQPPSTIAGDAEQYLPTSEACSPLSSSLEASSDDSELTPKVEDLQQSLLSLVEGFGVLFQILDDYKNLRCASYHEQKSFCEDLSEGKFSYLTSHAVIAQRAAGVTDWDEHSLVQKLGRRPKTVEEKRVCLSILDECHSFEAAADRANDLFAIAQRQCRALGGNKDLESIIGQWMLAAGMADPSTHD
jgi:geranylgeranyl diphosphate synthase type 3